MKPTILLINFKDQQKLRKLKMALLPFKIRLKTVESQDYCQPIGYLAGLKEIGKVETASTGILSALIPQEQMEKEMPDAGLAIFENDDHWAYWHQPDRFNAVLDIFFKGDEA